MKLLTIATLALLLSSASELIADQSDKDCSIFRLVNCWETEIQRSESRYQGYPVFASDNTKLAGIEFRYYKRLTFAGFPLQSLIRTEDVSYRIFVQDSLSSEKKFITDLTKGTPEELYYMTGENPYLVLSVFEVITETEDYFETGKKIYKLDLAGNKTPILPKENKHDGIDYYTVYPSPNGEYLVEVDCLSLGWEDKMALRLVHTNVALLL